MATNIQPVVALIASESCEFASTLWQTALASLAANAQLQVRHLPLAQAAANPDRLEDCAAAWIAVDQPHAEGLYEVLGSLQDSQIGTMLSRKNERQTIGSAFVEGTLIAPPQADPHSLALLLRTLLNQSVVIRGLRTELALVRAHHGGMVSQFGKIDEELRLAAKLQREFLPSKTFKVQIAEFDVLFRPASYVSGDIYDVTRLDEEHVGIFLADAVGHGVPAALMTVYIKRALLTKDIEQDMARGYRIVPPHEALAKLNKDIIEHLNSGQLRTATAVYAVLNTRTLRLQLARAGHPYPIILRRSGQCEFLKPEGAILGVFEDEQFELGETRLDPGDRLLFYSDGFEMAFRAPGEVGRPTANSRYLEEFKDLAHGTLDQAMDHLARKLDDQAGSLNQDDDLTALLLGIPPSDAVFAGHDRQTEQIRN